ncbi:MAG TPA: ABC transporter substrate-binding protein, partial [Candidatus Binataceae bacterium]|nr:ABC transporter substrate-binding protein [Candidatus Binataceae bacterium]
MNSVPRFFAFAFAAFCAVSPARAELQTLHLTMPAIAVYYAPYMFAIEKGYYAEEGLTIDATMAGGGAATPALLSGTVDLSTSA